MSPLPSPRSLLFALLLLLPGAPLAAQTEVAEETFTDEIEVSLVNLEVVVADRKGKSVSGLTKDDFQVLEDGKPVEVTNFYAETASASGSAEPRSIDQRLSLVVFVDDYNTEPESRNSILNGLTEFLTHSVSPGDQVMLVRFGRSLEVRKPFTTDVGAVLAEVEVIRKLASNLASRETSRDHQIQVVADALMI